MTLQFQFNPDSAAESNMTMDLGMMEQLEPCLRVYTWNPSAITLGQSQKEDILNLKLCKKNNLTVVSRFTGGAAVLHKDEITYAFFYPSIWKPKLKAIAIREKVKNCFLSVFTTLKIPVTSATNTKWRMPESAICFHGQAEHEILVDGRKIVGNAQTIKRCGIFQHGSIIRKQNEKLFCQLLKNAAPTEKMAALDDYCPNVSDAEIAQLIRSAFEKEFSTP